MTTKPPQPTTSCSQDAAELRANLAELRALVQALEAERAVVVKALLATGVEPASDDPVQLAAQVAELMRQIHDALGIALPVVRVGYDLTDDTAAAQRLWDAGELLERFYKRVTTDA